MNKPTWEQVEKAISVLQGSGRGQKALRQLVGMLDDGAVSLDEDGQAAVFTLLAATWGEYTGSARDAIRDALDANP